MNINSLLNKINFFYKKSQIDSSTTVSSLPIKPDYLLEENPTIKVDLSGELHWFLKRSADNYELINNFAKKYKIKVDDAVFCFRETDNVNSVNEIINLYNKYKFKPEKISENLDRIKFELETILKNIYLNTFRKNNININNIDINDIIDPSRFDLILKTIINAIKTPIKYKESDYLGSGAYSDVKGIILNDKRFVEKRTKHKKDSDILNKIKEIKNNMGELGKHLPLIVWSGYDDKKKEYVHIVERLEPIESNIKQIMFPNDGEHFTPFIKKIIKDTFLDNEKNGIDYIYRAVKRILLINKIRVNNNNNIKDICENAFDEVKIQKKDLGSVFYKFVERLYDEGIRLDEVSIKDLSIIFKTIFEQGSVFAPTFPKFSDEYDGDPTLIIFNYLPETASFMKALKKLKDFGLNWGDIHEKNVMQRPGTGELVISDPGNFYVRK